MLCKCVGSVLGVRRAEAALVAVSGEDAERGLELEAATPPLLLPVAPPELPPAAAEEVEGKYEEELLLVVEVYEPVGEVAG